MATDFDSWIAIATKDLVPEAAAKVRLEKAALPLEQLGDPEWANRCLCREYLTKSDVYLIRMQTEHFKMARFGKAASISALWLLPGLLLPAAVVLTILGVLGRLDEFPWIPFAIVAVILGLPVAALLLLWPWMRQISDRFGDLDIEGRLSYNNRVNRWMASAIVVLTIPLVIWKPEMLALFSMAFYLPLVAVSESRHSRWLRKLRHTGPVAGLATK